MKSNAITGTLNLTILWRGGNVKNIQSTLTRALLVSLLAFAFSTPSQTGATTRQSPGIVIKGATIMDGGDSAPYSASVLIEGDRILAIGDFDNYPGDLTVDASGLVLAPGFIDTHSHHDKGLEENRHATAALSQGITTIVVGLDGYSDNDAQALHETLSRLPAAVNVATYTGHGNIRSQVMGNDYKREASAREIEQMAALLTHDMAAGSLGLSTGLEYDPGIYSSTAEVIALAKAAAQSGGRYASHMRSEDRDFDLALEELLSIGREAQLPVHVSHIKLASVDLWGRASDVLRRLEKARSEGIDVSADIYPYSYWESTLTVLLPERDFQDLDAARYALEKLAPAEGLTLTRYDPNPSYVGMSVAEIARQRKQPEAQTYLALINTAYPVGDTSVEVGSRDSVMGVSMSEEDIEVLMAWPHTNICSDGSISGHPRGYGAFPRALRHYAIDKGITSVQEMIRKMTGLAATHVGLAGRGMIQAGYVADLVLLDPDAIEDRATIAQHDALSQGIHSVWVNGVSVWSPEGPTGQYPGKFIVRPGSATGGAQ